MKQLTIALAAVCVVAVLGSAATPKFFPDDPIALTKDASRFVSRGGDKLDGAFDRLDVTVAGRRWFDVGASTGGFTDRLLQGGAAAVCAPPCRMRQALAVRGSSFSSS